jgi:hypothetical protein
MIAPVPPAAICSAAKDLIDGRAFGMSPTAYRASYPPASARVRIPTCVRQA